jgi:hypothetical protein
MHATSTKKNGIKIKEYKIACLLKINSSISTSIVHQYLWDITLNEDMVASGSMGPWGHCCVEGLEEC